MKQERILEFLHDCPEKLEGFAATMRDLYLEEFGGVWIAKEMQEATEFLLKKIPTVKHPVSVVRGLFKFLDQEKTISRGLNEFIGTRQVSPEQFCNYSKGPYFMAAYLLIKKN